jgi:hypothetical protein
MARKIVDLPINAKITRNFGTAFDFVERCGHIDNQGILNDG